MEIKNNMKSRIKHKNKNEKKKAHLALEKP